MQRKTKPAWLNIGFFVCLAPFCWAAMVSGATVDEQEVYAVVYAVGPDGQKGRRVYLETFYLAPSEKRAAFLDACGVAIYNDRDKVDRLRDKGNDGYRVIVYRTTVDPATRNTRREEICRLGG